MNDKFVACIVEIINWKSDIEIRIDIVAEEEMLRRCLIPIDIREVKYLRNRVLMDSEYFLRNRHDSRIGAYMLIKEFHRELKREKDKRSYVPLVKGSKS